MYNLKNKYFIENNKIIFEELYAVLDIAEINENYSNFLVNLSKKSTNSLLLNVTNYSVIGMQSVNKLTFKIKGYVDTSYLNEEEKEVVLSYVEKNKDFNFSIFII